MINIQRIISGGQTGADRAAFDFALENKIDIGGFVPKNRLAEDGRIPDIYPNLIECDSEDVDERTYFNVINSDATLIFAHGELTGGSKLTEDLARKYQKPVLHIDLNVSSWQDLLENVRKWLYSIEPRILNIAGARASEDADIYQRTFQFLSELLKKG